MVESILFGIATGSILLLAAVGFTLTRRVHGFLNISHAELLTVGAFLAYVFNVGLSLNLVVAGLLGAVLTGLVAMLLGWLVFEPIKYLDPGMRLITSVGLAYVLHGIVEVVGGVQIRSFVYPKVRSFYFLGKPTLSAVELITILCALLSVAALHLFLTKTNPGKSLRAMASNLELASVRGVDTDRISLYLWFVVGTLAGLAGVLAGTIGKVHSELGWSQIMIIMCVAVIGGLSGSIYGVMAAAFLVGIVIDVSAMFIPTAYCQPLAFAVLIAFLLIRPQGLFGEVS